MFASVVQQANCTTSSAGNTDLNSNQVATNSETDNAFDDILSQLNALGSTIDQELSSHQKEKDCSQIVATVANTINNNTNNSLKSDTKKEMAETVSSESNYYSPNSTYHYRSEISNRDDGDDDGGLHFYPPPSPPSTSSAKADKQYFSQQPQQQQQSTATFHHYYSDSGQSLTHSDHNNENLEMNSRTDSPDNDSAFSDTISLISSEQSSSSSSSDSKAKLGLHHHHHHHHHLHSSQAESSSSLTEPSKPPIPASKSSSTTTTPVSSPSNKPQQQLFFESKTTTNTDDSNQKDDSNRCREKSLPESIAMNVIGDSSGQCEKEFEEKIRGALEKIREANYRKLYLKVFAEDNSAKSLLADERMTIGAICRQLAQKNHIPMESNHCIIEHMPQLYLERFYEDHESLVENVLFWGRDSGNKLYFMPRQDKYELFVHPEKYLISSQPNESADTLKSGSLRAKYNANQLRTDLIGQFFSSGAVKVPDIEGSLYLRSEKKKVWKKYFFTLKASGLYYSPKGKPKSTKDLICLTTFEMNCVYYGFGWRKKFKSPNEFGFAIKHPQIQCKSPKQIKYLCAESEDELRLWMTGIRIAKYGTQLLDNYKQFTLIDSPESVSNNNNNNNESAKPIHTFPLQDSNGNSNGDYHQYYYEDHYGIATSLPVVVMRQNMVSRNDSIRSSSASSSSGCMSESSSNQSPGNSQASIMEHIGSPLHHGLPTQASLNGFDADFPLGTIKRKPSVMLPKIPLTNTTRNLALQSDDALLEVNDNGSAGEDEPRSMVASPGSNGDFQRGTFKTGTLRRSNTAEERIKVNKIYDVTGSKSALGSPPPPPAHYNHHQQPIYSPSNQSNKETVDHSDEDLPPPPPPLNSLKETQSSLSLNSFPPPPSPEMLQPNQQQQQQVKRVSSPHHAMSPLPLPTLSSGGHMPMTPQPQPKHAHRLARRLSDLSSNSSPFMNFRNNYNETYQSAMLQQPNSRASIATAEMSAALPAGFVTMKSSLSKPRFQRQTTVDLHSLSKYGTSPRIRACEQSPQQQTVYYGDLANFYNRQQSLNNLNSGNSGNQNIYGTYDGGNLVANSHCSLVEDNNNSSSRNSFSRIYSPQSPIRNTVPASPLRTTQQQPKENHYMSISPHLLQKHQQMQRQQQQQQQQAIYSPSYNLPADQFLKNMERVMNKKWHVAQMLNQDQTATPGQVLGFRDSAYLPPPPPPSQPPLEDLVTPNHYGAANYLPPPPPLPVHYYPQNPYQSYNGNGYGNYQPQPQQQQQASNQPIYQQRANSSPYHSKSVRISEADPVIINSSPSSPISQYSTGSVGKRVPPPPPKRSETTQLTAATTTVMRPSF